MDPFYDKLTAQDSTPEANPQQQPDPFYDKLVAQDQEQGRLRASVMTATEDTPEAAARRKYLTQMTGVPDAVVKTSEGQVSAMAKLRELQIASNDSPELRYRLQHPEFTALAQNDGQNLGLAETALRGFGEYVLRPIGGEAVPQFNKAVYSLLAAPLDLGAWALDASGATGTVLPANPLAEMAAFLHRQAAQSQAFADAYGIKQSDVTSSMGRGVQSGVSSLWQSLLLMPMGAELQGEKALTSVGPMLLPQTKALLPIGAVTAGQAYGDAVEANLPGDQAALYALQQGGVEMLTEALPFGEMLGHAKGGSSLLKTLGKVMIEENVGEQIATAWQDANEWLYLHPENTLQDYLAERPDAALQTLIATTFASGLQTGAMHIATSRERAAAEREHIQRAQEDMNRLQELLRAASGSQVRELDQPTFASFVQAAAERAKQEGRDTPTSVFVDGRTLADALAQSGMTQEQIDKALPSVSGQLADAMAVNAPVEIPIGELTAALPGSPLEAALLPDLRMRENGLSLNEAKQRQELAQQFLEQESQRVLGQAADAMKATAATETVRQKILADLNATGRFSQEVNDKGARLASQFYTIMGERMGMAPDALYNKIVQYHVQSQGQGGLNSQDRQPFNGSEVATTPLKPDVTHVEVNGVQHPAVNSNGQPIHWSEEGVRNFWRAFGDSKAVDAQGRPLVVYHGTHANKFNVFKTGRAGAIYFSADKAFAGDFGPTVVPSYLRIKNLANLTDPNSEAFKFAVKTFNEAGGWKSNEDSWDTLQEAGRTDPMYDPAVDDSWEIFDLPEAGVMEALADAGYDGVKLQEGGGAESFAVFSPEQVKSATGNSGAFNPANPDTLQQSVTTQVSKLKNAQVDPTDVRVPGLDEASQPGGEEALAHNVELFNNKEQTVSGEQLRGYDSIVVPAEGTPLEKANAIIDQMVRNLLTIYDAIPDAIRQRSRLWYVGANRIASAYGQRYDLSLRQAAAQLAVTSPQADWFMNVSYVERVNDILSTKQDHTWDEAMNAWATSWIDNNENARNKETAKRAQAVRDAERDLRTAQRAAVRVQEKLTTDTPALQAEIARAESALEAANQAAIAARATARKTANRITEKASAAAQKTFDKANNALKDAREDLRVAQRKVGKAQTVARKAEKALQEKRERAAEPDENLAVQSLIRGKKLSELTSDFERAWWVRAYDEAHNPRHYRIVTPEGGFLGFALTDGGAENKIGWKSFSPIAKAISIYYDGSIDNIHAQLGNEHKVRNFYNNIFDPNSEHPFVTSDTHQVAANLFMPLGADALEVAQNFGGTGTKSFSAQGLNGTYWLYSEAVRRAAQERGVLPREMQSISWEAIRSLFSDTFKSDKKKVAAVRDLWVKYANGEASYDDTIRDIIELAGGRYRDPAWVGTRPDSAAAPENGAASYESQLAHTRQGLVGRDESGPGNESVLGSIPSGRDQLNQSATGGTGSSASLRASDLDVAARYGQPVAGASSVLGIHYSRLPRSSLSGYFYGTGLKGAERKRLDASSDSRLQRRIHFYVDTGQGVSPERGVGGAVHAIHLDNVYDVSADPLGIRAQVEATTPRDDRGEWFNAVESAVLDAGFDGVYTERTQGEQGVVVLLGDHTNVPAEVKGTHAELQPNGDLTRDRLAQSTTGTTGDGSGRFPDGSVAPLEGAPVIEGATGPDLGIAAVAERYALTHFIAGFYRQREYVDVDPEFAARIAQAYADMPHAPQDPEVREAYADLIRQTRAQYDTLVAAGYTFTFFDSNTDPYHGNPWNSMRDLRNNKHMAVYGTYDGYGTEGVTGAAVDNNPMLADTGLTWKDQAGAEHPVLANDLFRAVHDAFGHGLEGAGFRARGEENAWQAHALLYRGPALAALTSETRGQNSWLNYGPYGEKNRTAKLEDTVFAEQKTGLMPKWTWQERRGRTQLYPQKEFDKSAPYNAVFAARLAKIGIKTQDDFWRTWRNMMVALAGPNPGLSAVGSKISHSNQVENYLKVARSEAKNLGIQAPLREYNIGIGLPYERIGLDDKGLVAARFPRQILERAGIKPTMQNMISAYYSLSSPDTLEQPARGTYDIASMTTVLNGTADLSTFLHETGHFFLDAIRRMVASGEATPEVVAMYQATLKGLGVTEAEWEAWHDDYATTGKISDGMRAAHEKWAESFELYLFTGQSPNVEMRGLFRTFAAWLKRVYQSMAEFTRRTGTTLDPDLKAVMDRMLATDAQIAEAEQVAGMLPNLDATSEAQEKLNARSMRDLKWAVNARNKMIAKLQKQVAALRKIIEAEVRTEVEQMPVYRAEQLLRYGKLPEGQQNNSQRKSMDAMAGMKIKLGLPQLKEMYGDGPAAPWRYLPIGKNGLAASEGVHPDVLADALGYASGDALVRDLLSAEPIASVVEGITDQRMLERHGDLATPEAISQAATEAVHNQARAKSLATELAGQRDMLSPRQDTGRVDAKGRPVTVNALMAAARQFADNVIGRRQLGQLKKAIWSHVLAERRAAKAWEEATAKADTKAAVQAKQDQVLNNAAVMAGEAAQDRLRKAMDLFRRVMKGTDEKLVQRGYDPDIANAARAILAAYGIAPSKGKSAVEYLETLQKNDPQTYAAVGPTVSAALMNAKPLDELTVDELGALVDEVQSLWHLAKRMRQMEVDGDLLDRQDVQDDLKAELEARGIPATMPGDTSAITPAEQAMRKLLTFRAAATRVENWAQGMGALFTKYVFQPVKEAADRYRIAKADYLTRYRQMLDGIAPSLRRELIEAPELGYTFGRDTGGIAMQEILHAIAHTGNESNKKKLLLGRKWATERADGTLDTSRWDAFVQRMVTEGKLTKEHYDFVQGVWDLLESMKPLAQKTHRDVFGRYFAEVTADAFDTPFGHYRGGYVPAIADSRIVSDAATRKLAEEENESMTYAFPATNRGFTKGRVEYNRPLMLDLRTLAQHIDKVLLFSHLEQPVRDVRRVLTSKDVSYGLNRIDPPAFDNVLTPWLNRAARQSVEAPVAGDAGLMRVLSAARSRAGLAAMFANVSNAAQQITGFTIAAIKVKPAHLLAASAQMIAHPKQMKADVAAASIYMRDRMENEASHAERAIRDILLKPSVVESARNWSSKHAYFLQSAVDNVMGPVIWTAAFNHATEKGLAQKDAVRFADSVIRTTQGSTLPEDVSRIEGGNAFVRLFTQFAGYFNMQANLLGTEFANTAREMGVRKGAGRMLYLTTMGLLAPAWVAEAIAQAFRGGPDDEDKDGEYLDDWLAAVFGFGTLRAATAMVPGVGQVINSTVNSFNSKPYDDRIASSPAISMIESAVSAPKSIYKAIVDEGNRQKAVRDVATLLTLATGIPFSAVARPLGYLAGLSDYHITPTGPVDATRGVITGTASPASKN